MSESHAISGGSRLPFPSGCTESETDPPLALLAAQLLDESIGEFGREYVFIAQNPRDTSTDYHIYRADEQGRQTLPLVDDGQDQTMIEFVMENCPYLGFVRCEATQ